MTARRLYLPLYALVTVDSLFVLAYAITWMAPLHDMLHVLPLYFLVFLVHSKKSRAALAAILIWVCILLAGSALTVSGVTPGGFALGGLEDWVYLEVEIRFYREVHAWWGILSTPLWIFFLYRSAVSVHAHHRERRTKTQWGHAWNASMLVLGWTVLYGVVFYSLADELDLGERAIGNCLTAIFFGVVAGAVYRKLPGTKRLVVTT